MDSAKFDGEGFFAALDGTRQSRGLNWKEVANKSGVSASTLTRMGQGKHPDVDSLARLAQWGALDPADYIRGGPAPKAKKPETMAMISTYLRSDPHLDHAGKVALEELIKATYARLTKDARVKARFQKRGE